MSNLIAYVDGSYNKKIHKCSYASIFLDEKEENIIGEEGGLIEDIHYCNMRNVGGEIISACNAISYAVANGYDKITIYYDYSGIYEWVRGDSREWTANNICTKKYKSFFAENSKLINITFKKVKSHSQNKYNDMVDKIAKKYAMII